MKLSRALTTVVFLYMALSSRKAAAQDLEKLYQAAEFANAVPWEGLGYNAADRLRRSIAIGPFVGAHGNLGHSGEDGGAGISFGLGLSTFDVPILPDREELQHILKDRFKTLFLQKIEEAMQGNLTTDQLDLKSIAKQAWEDVVAAYLRGRKHRMLETPGVRAHIEGVRLLQVGSWQTRASLGMGLGNMTFGLTFGGEFGDNNLAFVGPEVTLQLLFGNARSPILDLFARADVPLGEKNGPVDISLGARFLLDVL